MRVLSRAVAAVLAAALVAAAAGVQAQAPDLDRELEAAKGLYRDAKFAQAIAKLQEAIARIDRLADLRIRQAQLADAHLHLALSYVALNDPEAAKESLKTMLRVDPQRRLDAEVYAPKVVELFERARVEVATNPAPVAAAVSQPPPAAKKGKPKLPLILVGVGGAAAAGVAVATGGGDGPTENGSGPSPGSQSPVTSGNITLVTSDPVRGSRFSLSSRGSVTFNLTVTVPAGQRACVFTFIDDNSPNPTPETPDCYSELYSQLLDPGSWIPYSVTLDLSRLRTQCQLPHDFRFGVDLYALCEPGRNISDQLRINAFYTIEP